MTKHYIVMAIWLASTVSWAAPQPIPVDTVEGGASTGVYTVDATVEALKQTTVAAQAQGRVLERFVKAGDRVNAGQVLMRLDARELGATVAASQATMAEAEAVSAKADMDLKRTQLLADKNVLSAAALEASQAQAKAARARVAALRANAAAATVSRSYAEVRAPYAGVVSHVDVEVGDLAAPGKPLLEMYQPGVLRAVAFVPESQLGGVKEGLARHPPQIQVGAQALQGQATVVVPATDPHTRTTEIRVDLPKTDTVTPGQFARVSFALPTGESRLSIPARAVLRRGELTAVYVRLPSGQFQQRQVRMGEPLANKRLEVLSGVKAGETVALDPAQASLTVTRER